MCEFLLDFKLAHFLLEQFQLISFHLVEAVETPGQVDLHSNQRRSHKEEYLVFSAETTCSTSCLLGCHLFSR